MNEGPSKPAVKPLPGERDTARRTPNGYVYRIAGEYGPNDAVPPTAIAGAWRVDEKGEIVGDFIPNPAFKPEAAPFPKPPAQQGADPVHASDRTCLNPRSDA